MIWEGTHTQLFQNPASMGGFETNEFDVFFLFLADFGSVREELSVSFDVVDAVILEPTSAMFLDLRR